MLGRYASNPDLSFSWYDAAVLSQKIRAADAAQPAPTRHRRFNVPLAPDIDDRAANVRPGRSQRSAISYRLDAVAGHSQIAADE